MGVVYEAEQLCLGRRVALKVLPFTAALNPEHRQRFQIEAHAAAQLHHPHIVPIFGVGCENGIHYYAMQFIDGHSLAAIIRDLRSAEQGFLSTGEKPAKGASVDADEIDTHHQRYPRGRRVVGRADQAREGNRLRDESSNDDPVSTLHDVFATPESNAILSGPARADGSFFRTVARMGIEAADALRARPCPRHSPPRYQTRQHLDRS